MTRFSISLALSALLAIAAARTDTSDCATTSIYKKDNFGAGYYSIAYYVEGTGEICRALDCGGGRAAPKNIPGCPFYKGDEPFVETTSYLDGWGPDGQIQTEAPESASPQSTEVVASITGVGDAQATSAVESSATSVVDSASTLVTSAAVLPTPTGSPSSSIPTPSVTPPPGTGSASIMEKNIVAGLMVAAAAAVAMF